MRGNLRRRVGQASRASHNLTTRPAPGDVGGQIEVEHGALGDMAAVGAHELASGRVLVPVRIVAVAAAADRSLAQLVELEGAGTALLAEAGGAAGAPVGEAREEDLVPEEGEEEHGDAREARGGCRINLEARSELV
jgi:hypothetical protein